MSTENLTSTTNNSNDKPKEVRIISHSSLFYWWPVWAVGFIMAGISWFSNEWIATVPTDTVKGVLAKETPVDITKEGEEVQNIKNFHKDQVVLVAPKGATTDDVSGPVVRVTTKRSPGVIFSAILLLVIFITNIHMRGLWSLIVIVIIISSVIILALAGAWDYIIEYFRFLDIRISAGGYLAISLVLFGLWLVVFLFFDRQIYMIFTPGQFRVRLEIGEGEKAYDTRGMVMEKVRSDFFRHWILGLGSGDMIVRTTGAHSHQFDMHNVLFLGNKVREIENMIRTHYATSSGGHQ